MKPMTPVLEQFGKLVEGWRSLVPEKYILQQDLFLPEPVFHAIVSEICDVYEIVPKEAEYFEWKEVRIKPGPPVPVRIYHIDYPLETFAEAFDVVILLATGESLMFKN